MFSSCKIIGTLCLLTVGGATILGTLGVATVIGILGGAIFGTYLGFNFVWGLSGCMLLNNVANILMVCNCLSPILKDLFCPGFFTICISSLAALVACSVVDNTGMTIYCVKNYTTYECLYPLVFGV